jgi:putative FmdB family regulatory protein
MWETNPLPISTNERRLKPMFYKFNCEQCGEIELNLKMSEIPLKQCPNCGCEKIERVFTATTSVWRCSGAFSKVNHKE